MGCRTEPAAVNIGHVLQRLHFFQFLIFFYFYTILPQKKLHDLPQLHDLKIFLYTSYIFHSGEHMWRQENFIFLCVATLLCFPMVVAFFGLYLRAFTKFAGSAHTVPI